MELHHACSRGEPTETQTATGLLMIRLVPGAIFIAHGAQKVFTSGLGNAGDGFGGTLVATGAGKWSVDAAFENRATSHVGGIDGAPCRGSSRGVTAGCAFDGAAATRLRARLIARLRPG